jgi:glycosyltransferase involved in cell wall biosynthesis
LIVSANTPAMKMDESNRTHPRILIIGNLASRWGGNRQVCEDLADVMKDAGWPVIAVSGKRSPLLRVTDVLATVWTRRAEYAVAQVDIFSTRGLRIAEAACWSLRRAAKPYILTLHGGGLPKLAEKQADRLRRLFAGASAITIPSGYLHDSLRALFGDLHVVRNGMDLSSYSFRLRTHARPAIIWARAFHALYQPWIAVKVVAALRRDFPEVRLIMAGPDKFDGTLERVRKQLSEDRLQDCIEIIGSISKSEMPSLINRGDVFLNTSAVDNAPVSLVEAMACGACIVSTNAGGIPYMIRDGETGLLAPVSNADALAANTRRLLRDDQLAKYISHNAGREAEQYSWSLVRPQWEALFTSVAQHPKLAEQGASVYAG